VTRVNDTGGSDWSLDAYLGYRLASNHEVFARLDRSVCATCTARIFEECRALPLPPGQNGA